MSEARTPVTPQEWACSQLALQLPGGTPASSQSQGGIPGLMGDPGPHQEPLPHVCAQDVGQGRQLTPEVPAGVHLDVALLCGGGRAVGGWSGWDWTPQDRGSWGGGPHRVLHPNPSSWEAWGRKRGGRAHPPPGAGPGPSAQAPAAMPGPRRISPWPHHPSPGPGCGAGRQALKQPQPRKPRDSEGSTWARAQEEGTSVLGLEELGPAPPPRVV